MFGYSDTELNHDEKKELQTADLNGLDDIIKQYYDQPRQTGKALIIWSIR